MACLNKLAIRGIRSFDDKQISVIEFFTPVTVIVGHNGSGKTTIIECLKYATTGDQPPNTRGGAFIHDPKMANEKEVKAQVKLRFHAANGTRMLAVRNLSVTVKKTSGLTMKTLESILAVADGNTDPTSKRAVISTKCAEMDLEIPHLLGVSKSVLENVIFCHQEESYWPLAEPAALKKKFDDIFEATRYTKALDNIKALRKDRVAELKAEKERLESLAREKAHADKLKGRIADINSDIAAKEIEHEEAKKTYEALVVSNQRFQDLATKFREMYVRVQSLQEKQARFQSELDDAKVNVQEVEGTDAELQERLRNFDEHVRLQKQKKGKEESTWQDLEDELTAARKAHVELVNEQGELAAEAKAQERRISEREDLIRVISNKHGIMGYDHSPLERDKVVEFIGKLGALQAKQIQEYEKVQSDEYNHKSRELHKELESYKAKKTSTRDQITERQSSIASAEAELDATQDVPSELRTVKADMDEKRSRIEKLRADVKAGDFERRLAEKTSKARSLEDRRDQMNGELRTLSLQADARAKLDIKRSEVKSKETDVANVLETNNVKFRKLVGADARADTMERDLERVSSEKDREILDLESQSTSANKSYQEAEAVMTSLQAQVRTRRDELKAIEKTLKRGLGDDSRSLDEALKEAIDEVNVRKEQGGALTGGSLVYERLLRLGKAKKICTACNRHLDDNEMAVFESYLKDQMKKTSPEAAKTCRDEEKEWQEELDRLQTLVPHQASINRLKDTEIPALEKQIKEQAALLPALSDKAEAVSQKVKEARKEAKDIAAMRQHANHVSRTQKDVARLRVEITHLEEELSATGTTKTADDVQAELDALSLEIRTNEREKQSLSADKERLINLTRTLENDLYSLQIQENNLNNRLRDKTALEERIETMKGEIVTFTDRLKDIDIKISDAQAPIERLDREYQDVQRELNARIAEAQDSSQELNRSVDKLDGTNKAVERYVREKRARKLKECAEQIDEHQERIRELQITIENTRNVIAKIEKEINEAGASQANLRENIRIRKLGRDIKATEEEINSYDMDEAAKSRRNFEDKYHIEKAKETDMQSQYAHIGGVLTSSKAQLATWEEDLKEFKNINKRYTDQLLKVKISEMANSDLEKYGKALDNAIMKYHSLKMEEVNDTMKHLWNKTYQGTDIDGIKVRSDVEGGASKRSYNYRVVMTKDQVEMDMRGRCSAGQKMLASIIIRLALSDSFGQNCGILALDEPTNALDTENIDALAASLVDIINERKNHSNFQLIIITHDENFLRKLGQSDVMEYYWRVSRDSRQKSVIERQRFR
ncbi:hypothetical protein PLICRDRAFT_665598 [Plicaturopsis crispa FD-325 SS-3]|nr:hypothetical protein PLICRDRAFT_665598 [Plicaturopsis crispa FD-325 SS-3]